MKFLGCHGLELGCRKPPGGMELAEAGPQSLPTEVLIKHLMVSNVLHMLLATGASGEKVTQEAGREVSSSAVPCSVPPVPFSDTV